MDKLVADLDQAVAGVFDGATVALGGFFTCGTSLNLTQALARQGAKNLTLVVMSVGVGNPEVNLLLENHQVSKVICNYPFYRSASRRSLFEQMLNSGEVECELYPMGTFVEKLRAAGAGIPAFYTPTGVGTLIAEGKEVRRFQEQDCLLELSLKPDFSFIHAWRTDLSGNVVFRKTARNYNPEIGMAGTVTVVESEEVLEAGALDPDQVHLPGIFVQRVVKVDRPTIAVTIEE